MRLKSRPLRSCTAAALLAIACGACGGDGPIAPPIPGSVRITMVTIGGDPDTNGYDLAVGSIARPSLPSNGTWSNDVPSGKHSITVEGVAENCTVSGPNPRTITVAPGARLDLNIEVVCAATGIAVTARTAGSEYVGGHQVMLNDRWAGMVGPNASVVISRLQPGTYTVSLGRLPDHCQSSGSNSLTFEVKTRTVTPVSYDVTCVAPTRVERIAYTDGNSIKTVNIDGTGTTQLVTGHSPSWSPDGSQIVFSDSYCDYYSYDCTGGIAIIHTETKNVRRLENTSGAWDPAWAPTGDAIAFVGSRGQLAITTVGASPTAVVIATPGVGWVSHPSWSPDGQRIVFQCDGDRNTDLCVVNRDGTKFQRLTSTSWPEWHPAWGPHGRIAFVRNIAQLAEIAILDPDGRITTAVTSGWSPAWSRDGSRIVFSSGGGLSIVDSDGRNLRRLTTGSQHDAAWRP